MSRFSRIARSPITIVLQQGVILAVAGWALTTALDHYSKRLDDNTQAIVDLRNVVVGQGAGFQQQFLDQERRITRLEDNVDRRAR